MTKKILISLMACVLCLGLMGSAFAYFSDYETSSGNTFTAGTLDLKVDGADDPLPVKFTLGPLAPGSSGSETYVLANAGTLAGFVDLENVIVANDPGTTPESEPTPDNGELGANLLVTVTVGGVVLYGPGSLDGLNGYSGGDVPLGASPATINAVIDWEILTTVGNVIQGDVATVSITFELQQKAAD